jgi:NADPH:quinone reductase-like Zn-dependent oxidoreductase
VIDRVFPFDDAPLAEEWMHPGRRVGKVILEVDA